jgi:hypothetical protein
VFTMVISHVDTPTADWWQREDQRNCFVVGPVAITLRPADQDELCHEHVIALG